MTDVHGRAAPDLAALRDAFAANFETAGDIGAAVAVVRDGELVADLWGGHLDAARTKPWRADSVVNVWSTTKGVTALCFAMLVERGKLAYEDKVAAHWPDFAAEGKEDVTVAQLLSHQAGLCGFRTPAVVEDFYDSPRAAARLAAQAPFWVPGTACGYHAITIGFLAAELFRRVEGRTLTRFVAEELAGPFGLDFSIGLSPGEAARAADIVAPAEMASSDAAPVFSPAQVAALANPVLDPLLPNTAGWRGAEIPAANGFGNARALARLYGALAGEGRLDGKTLVTPQTLAAATAVRIAADDRVLGIGARWAAGFLRNVQGAYGPNEGAFGHSGWGGSFAFADPARRLAVAYTMNAMGPHLVGDPRNMALIAAVYGA